MGKFRVSTRGGPFYDGLELHEMGSVVEIPPEKYELLLGDNFDPTDAETAQALLDHHVKHREEKPKLKGPVDPVRVAVLERAVKYLPAIEAQDKAHAEADAVEAKARQEADLAAATNPDPKAAAKAKQEAYAKAAETKAAAYKSADDAALKAAEESAKLVYEPDAKVVYEPASVQPVGLVQPVKPK